EAALNDPAGIAQRFAWFSGEPVTVGEAREIQQAATAQEQLRGANALIDHYGVSQQPQHVQEELSHVLTHEMQRTGDMNADLQTAWQIVNQKYQSGTAQVQRLANAERVVEEFRASHGNYDKYEDKIAGLLESGQVQRSGNPLVDLQRAYDQA